MSSKKPTRISMNPLNQINSTDTINTATSMNTSANNTDTTNHVESIPDCRDILDTSTEMICKLTENFNYCPVYVGDGWKLDVDTLGNSKGTCSRKQINIISNVN
jgi:hypothetical protein